MAKRGMSTSGQEAIGQALEATSKCAHAMRRLMKEKQLSQRRQAEVPSGQLGSDLTHQRFQLRPREFHGLESIDCSPIRFPFFRIADGVLIASARQ